MKSLKKCLLYYDRSMRDARINGSHFIWDGTGDHANVFCCYTVFSWTKKYHIIIQLCSTVLAEFNHALVHTNSSRDNEISPIDSHRTAV